MPTFSLFAESQSNDSVRVGYIDPDRGYVRDLSVNDANKYAIDNPLTTFILETRDYVRYMNINDVNLLKNVDLGVSSSPSQHILRTRLRELGDELKKTSLTKTQRQKIEETVNKLKKIKRNRKKTASTSLTFPIPKLDTVLKKNNSVANSINEWGGDFKETVTKMEAQYQDVCAGKLQFKRSGKRDVYINFIGGGGVGALGNPVIGRDGSILAVDMIYNGFGYKYPPKVQVVYQCGGESSALVEAVLGKDKSKERVEISEDYIEDLVVYENDDPGYGKRYDASGEIEMGDWNPDLYIDQDHIVDITTRAQFDPIRAEIKKYQDYLKKKRDNWFTTRDDIPIRISSSVPTSESPPALEVEHNLWNPGKKKPLKTNQGQTVAVKFEVQGHWPGKNYGGKWANVGNIEKPGTSKARSLSYGVPLDQTDRDYRVVESFKYTFSEINGNHIFEIKNESNKKATTKATTKRKITDVKPGVTYLVESSLSRGPDWSLTQGLFGGGLSSAEDNMGLHYKGQDKLLERHKKRADGTYGQSSTIYGGIVNWSKGGVDDIRVTADQGKFTAVRMDTVGLSRPIKEHLKTLEAQLKVAEADVVVKTLNYDIVSRSHQFKNQAGTIVYEARSKKWNAEAERNRIKRQISWNKTRADVLTWELHYRWDETVDPDSLIGSDTDDIEESFMNTWAVSPVEKSNVPGTDHGDIKYSFYYLKEFEYPGEYKYKAHCDDEMQVYINSVPLLGKTNKNNEINRFDKPETTGTYTVKPGDEGLKQIRIDLLNRAKYELLKVLDDGTNKTFDDQNHAYFIKDKISSKKVYLDTQAYTGSTEITMTIGGTASKSKEVWHKVFIIAGQDIYRIEDTKSNNVKYYKNDQEVTKQDIKLTGGNKYEIKYEIDGKVENNMATKAGAEACPVEFKKNNSILTTSAKHLEIYHTLPNVKTFPTNRNILNGNNKLKKYSFILTISAAVAQDSDAALLTTNKKTVELEFEVEDWERYEDRVVFDSIKDILTSNRTLFPVDASINAQGYSGGSGSFSHNKFYNTYAVTPVDPNIKRIVVKLDNEFGDTDSRGGHDFSYRDYAEARLAGATDRMILDYMEKYGETGSNIYQGVKKNVLTGKQTLDNTAQRKARNPNVGGKYGHDILLGDDDRAIWSGNPNVIEWNEGDPIRENQRANDKSYLTVRRNDGGRSGFGRYEHEVYRISGGTFVFSGDGLFKDEGGVLTEVSLTRDGGPPQYYWDKIQEAKAVEEALDRDGGLFGGNHYIIWRNIKFPFPGDYKVEIIADDFAELQIFEDGGGVGYENVNSGKYVASFEATRQDNKTGNTTTRFISANGGPHLINVILTQDDKPTLGPNNTILKSNPMGFALKITYQAAKLQNGQKWKHIKIPTPRSWYENPMGIAMVMDAPKPVKPKEKSPKQKGLCPNNPLWTTRFTPIGGEKTRWWPVRFELTSEQRALNQAGKWTNFHNRFAISPVPPSSDPGTDGSGEWHSCTWDVPIKWSGWYKLLLQADEVAKVKIDDYRPQSAPDSEAAIKIKKRNGGMRVLKIDEDALKLSLMMEEWFL